MSDRLKSLFEYQKFEKNDKLDKLIKETEGRTLDRLSDDALDMVNAAGNIGKIKVGKLNEKKEC